MKILLECPECGNLDWVSSKCHDSVERGFLESDDYAECSLCGRTFFVTIERVVDIKSKKQESGG